MEQPEERTASGLKPLVWSVLALLAVAGNETMAATNVGLSAAARQLLGPGQGVYVEAADGTVLVSQAASLAVHPASVSKIPTTLALLRKFGIGHRFVTTVSSTGSVRGDLLAGDLQIESDGDPYLVDENVLLIAARLNELGIHRVAGELRATGPLIFNWNSEDVVPRLQRALAGGVSVEARIAVENQLAANAPLGGSTTVAGLQFGGPLASANPGAALRPLLIHRSQELLPLVKQLNDYSNNIFKPLADAAGGIGHVEALARAAVPMEMRSEIWLGDGAGTDGRNRLSPRATVKLLRALEIELLAAGKSLSDALPVSGVDAGTLQKRLDAAGELGHVVGKTGTFGDYGASALTGALRTRSHGAVYFAILNHDLPIPEARRRQDAFVRALLSALDTIAWDYARDERPAIARAQVVMAWQ